MPKHAQTITNPELAILGLLAESPKHGYQIEQDIQNRGMRGWTDIGFSSIYHILNKLEAAGWLESGRQDSADRPSRKVYSLTPSGWQAYSGAVLQRLQTPHPFTTDFPLALANLGALQLPEIIATLRSHQATLANHIQQLQQKHQADRQIASLPWFVDALFEYSQNHMRVDAEFLTTLISRLENSISNGEKND